MLFDPWVRKIPWTREWQLIPVFLPGESHGQRSLVAPLCVSMGSQRVGHNWVTNIFTFTTTMYFLLQPCKFPTVITWKAHPCSHTAIVLSFAEYQTPRELVKAHISGHHTYRVWFGKSRLRSCISKRPSGSVDAADLGTKVWEWLSKESGWKSQHVCVLQMQTDFSNVLRRSQ